MKLLISFGIYVGFRGNKEHAMMTIDQIDTGIFSLKHPLFPGRRWYGLKHFNKTKTEKLGIRVDHVVKTSDYGKFPVLPEHPEFDFGGAIKHYVENMLPKSLKTDRFHRRVNSKNTAFLADIVVGKNQIPKLFEAAFKKLNISNWDTLRGHALRGLFATKLADAKDVNLKEGMQAMRQRSVDTFQNYNKSNPTSRANRLRATLNLPENFDVNESKKRSCDEMSDIEEKENKNQSIITPNPYKTPRQVKSSRLHSSVSPQKFSEFTQLQADGLEDDFRSLECVVSHNEAKEYRRMLGNYLGSPQLRQPSERENRIVSMRAYIQDMQRNHVRRMASFPYHSPYDESTSLYRDYLEFCRWKELKGQNRYVRR